LLTAFVLILAQFVADVQGIAIDELGQSKPTGQGDSLKDRGGQ
jgi:hypothetical protein